MNYLDLNVSFSTNQGQALYKSLIASVSFGIPHVHVRMKTVVLNVLRHVGCHYYLIRSQNIYISI